MAVSQHEQQHNPYTEVAKWNAAIISYIYTCAFPTVTSQSVFSENGLYTNKWWVVILPTVYSAVYRIVTAKNKMYSYQMQFKIKYVSALLAQRYHV